MLQSHQTAFTDCFPIPAAAPGLANGSWVETKSGWRAVETLSAGDRLATGDGGFRPLAAVIPRPADTAAGWAIPGGALGCCSDLWLPDGHLIALPHSACLRLFGVPVVLAPVSALAGHHGIRRAAPVSGRRFTLFFAEEELLWVQTGLQLLCPGQNDAQQYVRLTYGQTRALLLMMSEGVFAPDLAA